MATWAAEKAKIDLSSSDEAVVTLEVTVAEHRPPPGKRARAPYKVLVGDETGDLTLVFFKTFAGQMEKLFPPGTERIVSGVIELFDGHRQMTHPERVLPVSDAEVRINLSALLVGGNLTTTDLIGNAVRLLLTHPDELAKLRADPGIINAVVRPFAFVLGACFIILTFGLFLFVINAGMLLLTSYLAGELGLGFNVDGFWSAVFGSLIISVVSAFVASALGVNDSTNHSM